MVLRVVICWITRLAARLRWRTIRFLALSNRHEVPMADEDPVADAVRKIQDDARRELARRALLKLPERQQLARQKLVAAIGEFLEKMNQARPVPNPGTHTLGMKDRQGVQRRDQVWSVTWKAWEFPEHFGLAADGHLQDLNKDWRIFECGGRFHLTPDGRLQNAENDWVPYREAVLSFDGVVDYDPMPEADAVVDALAALIRQHVG
jgi:hypothetical protein